MKPWSRPAGDSKFHAVSAVVYGGSVQTRCRGRWPESHESEEHDSPPEDERCGACLEWWVENGMTRRGLEELVRAVDVAFDMTDVEETNGGEG